MGNNVNNWYLNLGYQEVKRFIRDNIRSAAREFVATGYYLKYVRDWKLFREDGYKDIWEFAQDQYGISRSVCSRWMAINDKFSEDGNSPILAEKYRDYGKSQLQEMLYLEDRKLDEVTPGMTAKGIRGLRKRKADAEKDTGMMCGGAQTGQEQGKCQAEGVKHYEKHGCITGWSRYPDTCSCCGYGGAECCSQCELGNNHECNSRCGWIDNPYIPEGIPGQMTVEDFQELLPDPCAVPHKEDGEGSGGISSNADNQQDPATDAGYHEVEKYEELSSLSDMDLLKDKLGKEQRTLALMQEEFTDMDWRVRLQKLVVGALAANICDMDNVLNPPPESVQPEMPVLKNNEQRKEWLRNYKAWGLWYVDEHTGCKYYKYDFENGARLIAETFLVPGSEWLAEHESYYLHLVGGPEPPKDKTGCYGKWQRNKRYNRYPNSDTELVEFLKFVQKGK